MKLKDCVIPLNNYPDNGTHLECVLDLPCSIEKGFDPVWIGTMWDKLHPTKRHLWYIFWLDTDIAVTTKGYKTLEKAVGTAFDEYLKWLEFEKERVIEHRKELEK